VAQDPNFKRLGCVRYADDFLVGIIGPRHEALEIREKIQKFLKEKLNLELNLEKTHISNPIKHDVKFLGYTIGKSGPNAYTYVRAYNGKKRKVRTIRRGSVYLKVDIKRVIHRLAQKKFCTKEGYPLPNFYYLPEPQTSVIRKYSMIIRGLEQYYKLANNKRQAVSRINYIMRYSAAKLFAAKYKLRSIAKVFAKAGKDLKLPIKAKRARGIPSGTDQSLAKMEEEVSKKPSRRLETPTGLPFTRYSTISKPDIGVGTKYAARKPLEDPLEPLKWRSSRGSYAFGLPCAICGEEAGVEMHH